MLSRLVERDDILPGVRKSLRDSRIWKVSFEEYSGALPTMSKCRTVHAPSRQSDIPSAGLWLCAGRVAPGASRHWMIASGAAILSRPNSTGGFRPANSPNFPEGTEPGRRRLATADRRKMCASSLRLESWLGLLAS